MKKDTFEAELEILKNNIIALCEGSGNLDLLIMCSVLAKSDFSIGSYELKFLSSSRSLNYIRITVPRGYRETMTRLAPQFNALFNTIKYRAFGEPFEKPELNLSYILWSSPGQFESCRMLIDNVLIDALVDSWNTSLVRGLDSLKGISTKEE